MILLFMLFEKANHLFKLLLRILIISAYQIMPSDSDYIEKK